MASAIGDRELFFLPSALEALPATAGTFAMEFSFDLMSFVLGGAAAILGLHLAKLIGHGAGRIFFGLTNPEPSGWICPGSTSSAPTPTRISTISTPKARGQRLSGS
jgi:hypothetical protein